MAHPVDRRGRALGLVLVGAGEEGGLAGEAELEEVEAVAEPDQVGAELVRGDLDRPPAPAGGDGAHEGLEGAAVLVLTITHLCSIEHMFAPLQRLRTHPRTAAPRRFTPTKPPP